MKLLIAFFIALAEFFCRIGISMMLLFTVGSLLPMGMDVKPIHHIMLLLWSSLPLLSLGVKALPVIYHSTQHR